MRQQIGSLFLNRSLSRIYNLSGRLRPTSLFARSDVQQSTVADGIQPWADLLRPALWRADLLHGICLLSLGGLSL